MQDGAAHWRRLKQEAMKLDQYRGALETSLLSALQFLVPLPLPTELREQALQMINQSLVARLGRAADYCAFAGDFIAAQELQARRTLWNPAVSTVALKEWEDRYLGLVALQSVLEMADALRDLRGIVLFGFAEAEQLLPSFDRCSTKTNVVVRDTQEALSASDRCEFVYLVERQESCSQLVAAGVAPGHVFCHLDVMNQYRILPREVSS
jgi:hypothetical protein